MFLYRPLFRVAALSLLIGLSAPPMLGAQGRDSIPTIESKTAGMQKLQGFIPMYWEESSGKMWMEIGRWNQELLHYTSLPAGMGQNDIGLNRGDLSSEHVVVFRRVGPRVLMEEPNYRFRAVSDDALERKSVDDGFPTAVHHGFTVAAQTGDRVLVDATDFFMRDWHGVVETLRRSNQGTFRLDTSRSAFHLPRTKAFPKNTEVEITLTFTSDQPGALVRSVAPTAGALTLREHHSFVELPPLGEGFTPRKADPRAGYNGPSFMDFARPIDQDLEVRYIARHRILKKDPAAARSEPVEPIIYYLDPGTPEPVRSALLEGGSWWNQAFEAAGFIGGFRMEVLPADADPMDARYNVVQWVHRSTRGWSYGNSIVDPRTGEILKGHVTLGSLRVRQDYLIGEGLTAPYPNGDERAAAAEAMAVHRIRQLSAHEIGHTLGLSHNYIASAQRDHGVQSVMDYPHPRATLEDGGVHVGRDSYDEGIGAWDKVAIQYGYTDFPQGTDEDAALEDILQEGMRNGITFITDQDGRPAGSAHPQVHLWDNGSNVAAELERMMDVRRVALDRFGEAVIKSGEAMATMEEALVPLYLHHRYQAEATTKVVAGQYYTYAMRGDGQEPLRPVPAAEQKAALAALMRTLDPGELTIPRNVLASLPPRPHRYNPHQELFARNTGLVFDAVSPAIAAADATLQFLLHPERAARMVQQHALDASLPALPEVLATVRDATFGYRPADGYEAEVNRAVEAVFVSRVMALAGRAPAGQVRAEAQAALDGLGKWMTEASGRASAADQAHYRALVSEIARFTARPHTALAAPDTPDMPPGSPIGQPALSWLGSVGWGPGPDLGTLTGTDLTCTWR
ncbi:MAG: zinc-dependent metalloprotease [Gemmatimonadota bacterium]|nr:zinc-dependent metalloprotease [Gemmatimonadota bacterium]